MKIALLQVNPTVGDLVGNARLILDALGRARDAFNQAWRGSSGGTGTNDAGGTGGSNSAGGGI
jgi:hypothetical protein